MPKLTKTKTRSRSGTASFRRSSNIERDRDDHAALDTFILTACARRTLRRLLEGVSQDSQHRAWTLTGPFGTGKSTFCLFAAALLNAGNSPASRRTRERVSRVDDALASIIKEDLKPGRGLVTILVTGNREPLHSAITRGFVDALKALHKARATRLAADLERFGSSAPSDFLNIIDRAAKCLVQETPGARNCILILDEMGKLLEFAAANPEQSDVYLLQQIAEMASRPHSGLSLLGVLHQDFTGYAKTLLPAQQHEWEKIRGRFEDIVFEQSAEDMIRLIAEAAGRGLDTSSSPAAELRATYRKLWQDVMGFGVFPILKDQQQDRDILEKCFPLHPAVALLLGPVFKRFGQNERSAFSFLRSAEPFGLPDFAAHRAGPSLYRLVDLYQYLTGVFGDALLASRDGRRWADAFSIEAQNPSLTAAESDVLRTISILTIVGRLHNLPATADTVALAVAPVLGRVEADEALHSLLQKSAVVYRKFNKSFSLWEGSDIDVEAKIAEARAGQASDVPTTHLLRSVFAPRPLVARRHSFVRGTLRYFDMIPVSSDLPGEAADSIARSTADGHLLVLLHDLGDPKKLPVETARALTTSPSVLLCVPGGAREVDSLAREIAAIDIVEHSIRELHNDQTALRELAARKDDIRRRLDQALAELLSPAGQGTRATRWIRKGSDIRIRSQRELNERLSEISDELFPNSPIIQNEIINRRELSSSAAAAQGNLLKAMVQHGELEGLGIEGNPPEKSIYLSVLRELGIHRCHEGQWQFSAGPTGIDSSARPMMKAVRHFLDESAAEARPLSQLFALLRAAPFGLRDGVIPIVACAALLAHEADVAIYENGAFLPQITEPVLEQLVKSPGSYTVRRWQVDGVRSVVFVQLAEMLGQSAVAGKIGQRDLLDVVKPLLRFVRRLNEFCRATKTFSPTALAVRQALLDASEPDHLLFTELPKACRLEPFTSRKPATSNDIQHFRRTVQNALAELQKGYDTLLHSLLEELGSALESPPHPRGIRASLRYRAAQVAPFALNSDLRVFSTRLADAAADDRLWIESIASFLSNKHPSQWVDDDRARLGVRLTQIASAFRSLETLALSRQQIAGRSTDESVHLSVVGSAFPESKLVVHIAPHEADTVSLIEGQLRSVIEANRPGGQRRLVVAALARVVREALSEEASIQTPVEVSS